MPAIQLARLKLQAGHLRESFSRPDAFVRGLRYMLDFYSDPSHRRGQSGVPAPLIHAYNVPAPVLRQVILEISPLVKENPTQTLDLIDCLWKVENLECRSLAVTLLGLLPVDQPAQILERVETWLPASEAQITEQLLSTGLQRLRLEALPHFLNFVKVWMQSPDRRYQQLALRALVYPLEDPAFEDLPTLFRILTPLIRNVHPMVKQDLVRLLKALAVRSPNETAFFLRQNLPFPDVPWLSRQVLKELPEPLQGNLKKALKNPLPPI
jgi:hypothetical protein